ncbi:MAG: 3-methyladenine DNA glycosylase [Gordonia sp. (in: high G+C Gram-positive bacteria)]|uniref:3-methyladenine DNA glycosylase n=1 Tax=Gordonia sp. (in: high G+C Gram-positive bacteria) TaxID=84139 RepID=UPI0039E6D5F4
MTPTGSELTAAQWTLAAQCHRARVDALIGGYLSGRRRGAAHPVVDFLFTYYPYRPAQLRRWHPGFGVVLADPPDGEHPYASTRGYTTVSGGATVGRDYLGKRRRTLLATRALLAATAARAPRYGCYGLHEWAMVYRSDAPRHRLPLRLGPAGTDAVVEANQLVCTHFDAFRFFTDAAHDRNATVLTRADQLRHEQPGCLHATMDLYRIGAKLSPLVASDLVADAFELAYRAREIDMRASPYDLTGLGYEPIRVETADGRAEYVAHQRDLAAAGGLVRERLLGAVESLTGVLDPLERPATAE